MPPHPPSLLRIKRKRGDDPLQALILEGGSPKKSKLALSSPSFYFALSRTDDAGPEAPVLAETQAHHFVLPPDAGEGTAAESSPKLNPAICQMINELSVDDTCAAPRRRRRSSTMASRPALTEIQQELELQYVYDVYRLTSSEPFSSANHPVSQIGYIRFFDDDLTLVSDDDAPSPALLSDNEDSNAEDFYQNDYPSDEDAEGLVLPELGFDHDDGENDNDEGFDHDDGGNDRQFDSEFEFESQDELEVSTSYSQYADGDHNQYRDRIFGKLQKMIDEAD